MNANAESSGNGERINWLPLLDVATREVFEIMLGSKLTQPLDHEPIASCEVTAMVGLAGQLCGLLSLRCGAKSAALIASKMLAIDVKDANSEMWDAVGEVCNMVAGNFKSKLTGLGDRCMLSVPSVITGGDYNFHALTDSGPLELTFLFEGAPLQVALELHS